MNKMKLLAMAVGLIIVLITSTSALGKATIPLPGDLTITPIDNGLPPEIKAFFGQTGRWGGASWTTREGWQGPEAILIFEEISPNGLSAKIIYAWQDWPKWKLIAGWIRVRGKFEVMEEGKIMFVFSSDPQSRTKFQFEIKRGKLEGYFPRQYPSYIQMKPLP